MYYLKYNADLGVWGFICSQSLVQNWAGFLSPKKMDIEPKFSVSGSRNCSSSLRPFLRREVMSA